MSLLQTWQFNLLLYYVSVVTFFQCYKLAVKGVRHDGAATILFQTIAGLSVLLLAPLFAFRMPHHLGPFALLAVACIFYAVNDRLQTTVRKHLEVSVFSIIGQFSTVFLVLYGITFFREPVVFSKLLGTLLIIAGNVWLFYRPRQHKVKIDPYSALAILAAFAFATAISIDIGISEKFNLPIYISITLLLPCLFITLAEKMRLKTVMSELARGRQSMFFATGISWALAIFFSLRAFQLGEVSVIVPLQAVAVILNVLAAYVFLGERDKPYKKIVAAVLVMAGVLLTVL